MKRRFYTLRVDFLGRNRLVLEEALATSKKKAANILVPMGQARVLSQSELERLEELIHLGNMDEDSRETFKGKTHVIGYVKLQ